MLDRVVDVWGERMPHGRDTTWPVRVDQHLVPGIAESDVQHWVPSACVLCSNLLAGRVDEQVDTLAPIIARYGEHREEEPERLHQTSRAPGTHRRTLDRVVKR